MLRRIRLRVVIRSLGLVGLTAQTAAAMPLGQVGDGAEAEALEPAFFDLGESGIDFTGAVALSNCSGAVVRFKTSRPDDKAMVLSNGHCHESGFLDPGQVIVDQPSSRRFNLLAGDGTRSLASLRASRIMYATMTDTDMILYQLTSSFAEIEESHGVPALTISDTHPSVGAPIRVVSGFWKRIYSCSIDAFIYQLHEASWIFRDSIRYSEPGCDTIGGTSGSPIVHADTHEVIGVNNTGNDDGEECTMNNPCEVDANGNKVVRRGASYGQQLYQVYACLNDQNDIDLDRPGCDLPKAKP